MNNGIPSDWKMKPLAELCPQEFPIVYGIVQAGPHIEDGIPYIRSCDVGGEIRADSLLRTTPEIAFKYRRAEVAPGDIVFSLRGNIGELSLVPANLLRANLTQGTARIRVSKGNSNQFVKYALESPSVTAHIVSVAKGSTFQEISLEQLRKVPIAVPELPEQRAIAAVLSTWDRGIRQTTDLIAAKRRFKQGLMQELLMGKRRFPGFTEQWKRVQIGDVASEVSERNKNGNAIPVLSCTKYDGLVDSLGYFGRRVFSENTDNYKVVRRGDFAYATNHIEEGSIGLLTEAEAGLVSPMYTVFRTNGDVVGSYLFRVLKTETYRQIFESFTSASVDRRGSLRWKQFATIQVKLPSLAEQERINGFFTVLDSELSLLTRQLAALKTQKKGLMRKLLTGAVRVKAAP